MKALSIASRNTRTAISPQPQQYKPNHFLPSPPKKLITAAPRFATYCGYCGAGYGSDQWPKVCHCCKNTTFRNPIPVAVGLLPFVTLEEKYGLLLVRRNIKPFVGELCFPGGFIDWGESWKQAISREVREETQIDTDPNEFDLMDVHSTPDNTRVLIFGVTRKIRSHELLKNFRLTNETSEVLIGSSTTELCFTLHQIVYNDWFDKTLKE